MQCAVIKQVLLEGQVEVEGRLLEHDPDPLQTLQGPCAQIHAKDADGAFALRVEPGRERKQGGLAGAVQPQKDRELARLDGKRNAVQRPPLTKAMSEALDRKGGNRHDKPQGRETTPQGDCPTATDLITFCAPTSITEMSLLTPLVV